jgi:hypothetical protein
MKVSKDQNRFTLSALATLAAHSPILVSRSAHRTRFPRGYERVDIKILEWIRRAPQQAHPR